MNCLLCRANETRVIGRRSDFAPIGGYQEYVDRDIATFDRSIVACSSCGFQFITSMYAGEDFEALYGGPGYKRFIECVHLPASEELLEGWRREFVELRVTDLLAQAGRKTRPTFLDIGCGLGRNMTVFSRLGFDVCGLDMNEAEAAHVRSKLGFPVHNETLESFAKTKPTFDCILASHFIEHVADPHDFFEIVLGMLAPNGMLLIETPLANDYAHHAERYRDVYHTLFFDHFTLALLGAMHGAPAARMQNKLFFLTESASFNLYLQVCYQRSPDGKEKAQELARTLAKGDRTVLRAGRSAYDGLMPDSLNWARSHLRVGSCVPLETAVWQALEERSGARRLYNETLSQFRVARVAKRMYWRVKRKVLPR